MSEPSKNESRELIDAAVNSLHQGGQLLSAISDEHYRRKLPAAFNASIGGHYRHCLDHFRILLDASNFNEVNYDHRERGTLVESDRFAALNATRELIGEFEALDEVAVRRSLDVVCKTSYHTPNSQVATSSVGREIMYSVAHAVHHYALIGIMGGMMGLTLPAGFGVAPSTLKHQRETAAAGS
jgi:hypothetical protein